MLMVGLKVLQIQNLAHSVACFVLHRRRATLLAATIWTLEAFLLFTQFHVHLVFQIVVFMSIINLAI